ncbi:hypothetical protein HK099_007502, partial [Clydaea vesicula]
FSTDTENQIRNEIKPKKAVDNDCEKVLLVSVVVCTVRNFATTIVNSINLDLTKGNGLILMVFVQFISVPMDIWLPFFLIKNVTKTIKTNEAATKDLQDFAPFYDYLGQNVEEVVDNEDFTKCIKNDKKKSSIDNKKALEKHKSNLFENVVTAEQLCTQTVTHTSIA